MLLVLCGTLNDTEMKAGVKLIKHLPVISGIAGGQEVSRTQISHSGWRYKSEKHNFVVVILKAC